MLRLLAVYTIYDFRAAKQGYQTGSSIKHFVTLSRLLILMWQKMLFSNGSNIKHFVTLSRLLILRWQNNVVLKWIEYQTLCHPFWATDFKVAKQGCSQNGLSIKHFVIHSMLLMVSEANRTLSLSAVVYCTNLRRCSRYPSYLQKIETALNLR